MPVCLKINESIHRNTEKLFLNAKTSPCWTGKSRSLISGPQIHHLSHSGLKGLPRGIVTGEWSQWQSLIPAHGQHHLPQETSRWNWKAQWQRLGLSLHDSLQKSHVLPEAKRFLNPPEESILWRVDEDCYSLWGQRKSFRKERHVVSQICRARREQFQVQAEGKKRNPSNAQTCIHVLLPPNRDFIVWLMKHVILKPQRISCQNILCFKTFLRSLI